MELGMSHAPTRILYEAFLAARSEALRLGHNFMAPEHLILGLLQTKDGIASTVFDELEVDREACRDRLEAQLPQPEGTPTQGEIPVTEGGVSVLKDAMGAVDEDRVPYMSTGHLVMAVFEGDAWPDDTSKDLVALRARVERVAAASSEHEDLVSE